MRVWCLGILLTYVFLLSAITASSTLGSVQSPFADGTRPIKRMHWGKRSKYMFPEDQYDWRMPPPRKENRDLGCHRLRGQAYSSSARATVPETSPFEEGCRGVRRPRKKSEGRRMFLEDLKGFPNKPPTTNGCVSEIKEQPGLSPLTVNVQKGSGMCTGLDDQCLILVSNGRNQPCQCPSNRCKSKTRGQACSCTPRPNLPAAPSPGHYSYSDHANRLLQG